jgi:hypothetical protein
MSFELLPRRIRLGEIPELQTVERPAELGDPWAEVYELEGTVCNGIN